MNWLLAVKKALNLPGSQVKEHFDEQSIEHLQLLFSHEQAVSKE
jgi:hypothetical protein